MIITKTPLRISFFGGGTDYPVWFNEYPGAVLATTIDKYVYITCRYLPPFFDYHSRISYTLIELVKEIAEIKHPSVRECLKFLEIAKGVEIHVDGDLPARTGLGSSSSFTVGLLHSLFALKGKMVSHAQLAQNAIHVEQDLIKENVGCQDQILAAHGGFNFIEFQKGSDYNIQPVTISHARLDDLRSHLMLIFTGFSRTASEIAHDLIQSAGKKKSELTTIYNMVFSAIKILNGAGDIADFGRLLHENWLLKRSLTNKITTPAIDEIYETAMKNGALGGKLLGAGGGGFMLIFARPEQQPQIKAKLDKYLHVPFNFDNTGSQVVYYKLDEHSKV